MRKKSYRERTRQGRGKKAAGLCLTLAAMSGLCGLYYYDQVYLQERMQQEQEQESTAQRIAQSEEETSETMHGTAQSVAKQEKEKKQAQEKAQSEEAKQTAQVEKKEVAAQDTDRSQTDAAQEKTVETAAMHFDGAAFVQPVQGETLIGYSPDRTVYFETLNQYRYNPALILKAQVNEEVYSVADGVVTSVKTDRRTGLTATVDLGDGYSCVYGQLKELKFKEGDKVGKGEVLAYIGEPTKYYTKEGANLYLQLLKDKESVDPTQYFQ